METRANFVLIGAFTLAGIIGGLLFFVWLAQLQIDRQYDYYDVLFDNVSGLSQAGDVRFNGLPVGQVISLDLDQEDPGKVRVRIQVTAGTPIKEDTTAQLRAQGVTGVSFVSLDGGSPGSPRLADGAQIVGQRSVVEALAQDAPDLVSEAITLLKNLQTFIGPQNQSYVADILKNLDNASAQLSTALRDFSSITDSVRSAAGQVGDFTGRLEDIGASVKSALATAETTLKAADGAFAQVQTTLAGASGAVDSAGRAFAEAETVMRDQVPGIATDIAAAVAEVRAGITEIRAEVNTLLTSLDGTAGLASDRLTQLQATIASLDGTLAEATKTMAAVESASTSFETLMEGEGAALVADARKAFADAQTSIDAIDRVVEQDVPAIVADVRNAVATANRVIDQTGADITGFTSRLDPLTATAAATLETATQTLTDARGSLARLDVTMATAERTLAAAETAFTGANRVIDEEVAPTAADIRAAAERLGDAVTEVSADLPEITDELRATLARATDAIARIEAVVVASGPPIQDFATNGLPQFTRFTQEARNLVVSLERIATRLERDPARFLLGGQAPDYRR
jgi:phospholipid/cholesterol/gamma-HCH transport system substrate-binding protein